MIPVSFTLELASASANGIALSQSLGAAGALLLNGAFVSGGVATLDAQRRVILTSAGNDSGLTWTVKGTNQSGSPITDSFLGANAAAAQSNLDFLTVTSITASAATASSVTAGTNSVGSSPWVLADYHITPFQITIESFVSGTINYQVETTIDDFFSPPSLPWASTSAPRVTVAQAAGAVTATTDLSSPVRGWRATINSGTGSLFVEGIQSGIANY